MTAKEFLSQAYCLNKLIQSHQRELAELEEMGACISSPNYSGMPSGSRNLEPPFVKQVLKKVDLESQIRNEIDELIALKKSIHDAIDNVSDMNQRLVLRCKYIESYSWEQIADNLNYSMVTIYRLHREGLKNIVVP